MSQLGRREPTDLRHANGRNRRRAGNDSGPPVGRPLHPNRTTVEPVKRRAKWKANAFICRRLRQLRRKYNARNALNAVEHSFSHQLHSLSKARRAMAAGACSGIANTELTLISHNT
jgi:hypothetical protein